MRVVELLLNPVLAVDGAGRHKRGRAKPLSTVQSSLLRLVDGSNARGRSAD